MKVLLICADSAYGSPNFWKQCVKIAYNHINLKMVLKWLCRLHEHINSETAWNLFFKNSYHTTEPLKTQLKVMSTLSSYSKRLVEKTLSDLSFSFTATKINVGVNQHVWTTFRRGDGHWRPISRRASSLSVSACQLSYSLIPRHASSPPLISTSDSPENQSSFSHSLCAKEKVILKVKLMISPLKFTFCYWSLNVWNETWDWNAK